MTTRLTLVCHAPTAATRRSAFPSDEPIDPRYLKDRAVAFRGSGPADRRLTSPALCAVQTAEFFRLDATVDPLLRDWDHGRWAGLSFEAVQAEEPNGIAAWLEDPAAAPHGGEPLLALLDRAARWLGVQLAMPGRIVAVTHAAFIRAAIVQAIGAEPRAFWRLDIAPMAQVRLSGHGARWNLSSITPGDVETG